MRIGIQGGGDKLGSETPQAELALKDASTLAEVRDHSDSVHSQFPRLGCCHVLSEIYTPEACRSRFKTSDPKEDL